MLHIIPVIDLLDGHVVHAKHGQRHRYQPIESKLTNTSKPIDIVKAFLDIYPFQTLYIADLNAIQSKPNHTHLSTIREIQTQFPDLFIWLDAGINTIEQCKDYQALDITPILGTESFSHVDEYQLLKAYLTTFILSIDIGQQGYLGPSTLLDPNHWPDYVIMMTLAKVGSLNGVDMHALQHYQQLAPQKNIYAAGGVRHIEDLRALSSANIQGALIASALHEKVINGDDLTSLVT